MNALLDLDIAALSALARTAESLATRVRAETIRFQGNTDLALAWKGAAGDNANERALYLGRRLHWENDFFDAVRAALQNAAAALTQAQSDARIAMAAARQAMPSAIFSWDGTLVIPPFRASRAAVAAGADPSLAIAEKLRRDEEVVHAQVQAARVRAAVEAGTAAVAALKVALEAASDSNTNRLDVSWVIVQANLLRNNGVQSPNVRTALDHLANAFPVDRASNWLNFGIGAGLLDMGSDWVVHANSFYINLQNMTADELTEFFAALSPEQAAVWSSSWWGGGDVNDADGFEPTIMQLALVNHLVATLPPDVLREATTKVPFLQPITTGVTDHKTLIWKNNRTPLFHAEGPPINYLTDVGQGSVGDCYFLVNLVTLAQQHPEIIEQNITTNDNGSHTVRFFDDGKPVYVTVSADLPVPNDAPAGRQYPKWFADGTAASWAPVYEKAYAQWKGSYSNIEGGYSEPAMNEILGPQIQTGDIDSDDLDINALAGLHNGGHLMVAEAGQVLFEVINPWDSGFADDAQNVPERHTYAVVEVNVAANTVTVQNPWGDGARTPKLVTMTMEEFQDYFDQVVVGAVS